MTGVTIALAACWTARGCLHAIQLANTFSRTTTPIPTRPRYRPIGLVSSVPITMWFMFRTNPVSATMVTCANDEDDEGAHDRESGATGRFGGCRAASDTT